MHSRPFSSSPTSPRTTAKPRTAGRPGSASLPIAHPGTTPGSPSKGRCRAHLFRSPSGTVVKVKLGFSWNAFLVGSTTALVRRLWPLLSVVVLALAGHAYFEGVAVPGTASIGIAAVAALFYLGYMLFCGVNGNRWLAQSLRRRGYILVGEE